MILHYINAVAEYNLKRPICEIIQYWLARVGFDFDHRDLYHVRVSRDSAFYTWTHALKHRIEVKSAS